jgi:inosine-uridine nucleoside N-ribohydrolase
MRQLPIHRDLEANQSDSYKHLVLVDTDIGDDIDDALALALILHSPEIDLRGVTTVFGDTRQRARLAAYLLKDSGCENVPIAAGIQNPIQWRHRPSGVPQASVLDNRVALPALSATSGPELIVEIALAHHGRLSLLCLGPLTNIATALTIEPRLITAIRRIVMMGGSSSWPLPDWNVRSDARAAQIVLGAGIPVTMVGLNITMRCQLREQDIKRLHRSAQTQLLSRLLTIWQRHHPRWHPRLPYLHDPLTVAALCSPELFQFEEMRARVISRGPLQGFTVPRLMKGPLVHAAVDVRVEAAREWVMHRLLAPLPWQSS